MTAGLERPVHWWPARLPAQHDGVLVVGIAGNGDRTMARQRIRLALHEALVQLTGLAPADITLHAVPGQPPAATLAGAGGVRELRLAISHEGPLSLGAISLAGQVGIDLMQVQALPDWPSVARDYLGKEVADTLAGMAPASRASAFARAWTEREARLKCLGLPLTEWTPQSAAGSAACQCVPLALPAGLVGTLAY